MLSRWAKMCRALAASMVVSLWPALAWGGLPEEVRVVAGPVNSAAIRGVVAVYGSAAVGAEGARWVLFTHARRDVIRAGADLLARGATAVIPEREKELFTAPEKFWSGWETARFHDYTQVTTKVPHRSVTRWRAVRGGEVLELDGVRIEVLDTPGYTPGSVSYLVEAGGKRVVFSGDLIFGSGQILDLYSLQDAIPEAKVRGYHGYAARAADVINSLQKIAERKPDLLIPARGEVIERPAEAIDSLISRLRELMRSHFTTDALRWYWGEESLRIRSSRVLDGRPLAPMPMAEQAGLPEWVLAVANSRLLVSRSGAAFLVDAGSARVPAALADLMKKGRITALEGIWVSHYHDDHTEHVQELAERYRCPVYFTERMRDVLENPSHYRLPCLTTKPIRGQKGLKDGTRWRWREFELTAHFFPGQTLYHGGLLARRADGQALYFAGDSFTPSGMDDYCLQNRHFLHEELGYGRCLRLLEKLPAGTWLVNQHVEPVFRFTPRHLETMRAEMKRRAEILKELLPWPDPNYGLDESWARVYPYGAEAQAGQAIALEARVFNHSPGEETYRLAWNLPEGWSLLEADRSISVKPRTEGRARARVQVTRPGLHVVTVDVAFGERQLFEWTEALIRVR